MFLFVGNDPELLVTQCSSWIHQATEIPLTKKICNAVPAHEVFRSYTHVLPLNQLHLKKVQYEVATAFMQNMTSLPESFGGEAAYTYSRESLAYPQEIITDIQLDLTWNVKWDYVV